jgi:hypothetical protein
VTHPGSNQVVKVVASSAIDLFHPSFPTAASLSTLCLRKTIIMIARTRRGELQSMLPSIILPRKNGQRFRVAQVHHIVLLTYYSLPCMMATHAQNLLLFSVRDDPAITMMNHANPKLQLIVECLFLLRNKDNSETITSSLLLFCIKDAPAIMMTPLANFPLQLIVESFSTGAEQVAPARICNDFFKLFNTLLSERAQPASTISCNESHGLIVDFISIQNSEGARASQTNFNQNILTTLLFC